MFSLPKTGNKFLIASVHAVIFALIYCLTHKLVWKYFYGKDEGFSAPPKKCESGGTCNFIPIEDENGLRLYTFGPKCSDGKCKYTQIPYKYPCTKKCKNGKYCPDDTNCMKGSCYSEQDDADD